LVSYACENAFVVPNINISFWSLEHKLGYFVTSYEVPFCIMTEAGFLKTPQYTSNSVNQTRASRISGNPKHESPKT